jgi:hypothetical protein
MIMNLGGIITPIEKNTAQILEIKFTQVFLACLEMLLKQ